MTAEAEPVAAGDCADVAAGRRPARPGQLEDLGHGQDRSFGCILACCPADPAWGYEGPPEGREPNWIQTIPGKGWFTLQRLFGPLQPWFDQTWRPGEIEKID